MADMVKEIFGITKNMDMLQISLYLLYTSVMVWYVYFRNKGLAVADE